jgi:hypothetical protein
VRPILLLAALACLACEESSLDPSVVVVTRYPTGLATDEQYLYWMAEGGSIHRVLQTGGSAEQVVAPPDSGQYAGPLLVGGGAIVWHSGEALWTVPTSGGIPSRLSTGASFLGLAFDGRHAYWLEPGREGDVLVSRDLDGGPGTSLELGPGFLASALAVDGGQIYVGGGQLLPDGLGIWTTDGTSAPRLIVSDDNAVYEIVVDATSITYRTTRNVSQASRAGGFPIVLIKGEDRSLHNLIRADDGWYVIETNEGAGSDAIWRIGPSTNSIVLAVRSYLSGLATNGSLLFYGRVGHYEPTDLCLFPPCPPFLLTGHDGDVRVHP